MPIFYSCVTRQDAVLAEYSTKKANFLDFVEKIREKVAFTDDSRMSYSHERYIFHYWVNFGLLFICVADEPFGMRIPMTFLQAIQKRWRTSYGDKGRTAAEYGMHAEFSRVLQQQMDYYSNNVSADKFRELDSNVNELKNTAVTGLEKLLARGEKIELLMIKTDELQQNSFQIKTRSQGLANAMWWKNVKLYIIIALIVLVLAYVLFAAACGFPFGHNCFKGASKNTTTPLKPTLH